MHLSLSVITDTLTVTSNGAELRFSQDSGELTLEDGTIVEIEEHGRLYYLTSIGSHENDSVNEVDKVNLFGHRR
jgi:hypothetical protein